MNLSRTISISTVGGAISLVTALSAIASNPSFADTVTQKLAASNTLVKHLAQGLAPEQVNLRAKQITVRVDGANTGSGVIMERSGNTYTVLSNWHVMKKPGEYIVQTIDGREHQVNLDSIQEIPGLDLALFEFTSPQNYQLAEVGDSGQLLEGQNIYFAGYPGELRREDNRYYRFFAANLVGMLPENHENGYSLVYNGEAFPGMSGGPVFNRDGRLVGIHGEANINAISGGTSNYAIPINTYKRALAKLNNTATPPKSQPPEVIVDTVPSSESDSDNQTEPAFKPPKISSVPTLTDAENSNEPPSQTATNSSQEETTEKPNNREREETTERPQASEESRDNQSALTARNSSARKIYIDPRRIVLVSQKTGIDYTELRDLLKAKKWSEADIQTYKLVKQIVNIAKQRNRNIFIELKTIAEFSCSDIRTIDKLWKKYSGNKFGFSPQQTVWQNVNQNGDFSTQAWRRFATKVGWKEGEVNSSSGYLLFEELTFNPESAPKGHLPWWFALPEEEQNVIKDLFARCNFNPSVQELEAEFLRDYPELASENESNNESNEANSNNESSAKERPNLTNEKRSPSTPAEANN